MLGLNRPVKVFLYGKPCDMRKGFNGLFGLVRHDMGLDPISGHLYVFMNGGRNLIKVLYWDCDGLAVYSSGWRKVLLSGQLPGSALQTASFWRKNFT